MRAADGDGPPPYELHMAWLCERMHALPDVGGMHDQDGVLVERMGALQNIYTTVAKLRSLNGGDIHRLTSAERRLLLPLFKDGLL